MYLLFLLLIQWLYGLIGEVIQTQLYWAPLCEFSCEYGNQLQAIQPSHSFHSCCISHTGYWSSSLQCLKVWWRYCQWIHEYMSNKGRWRKKRKRGKEHSYNSTRICKVGPLQVFEQLPYKNYGSHHLYNCCLPLDQEWMTKSVRQLIWCVY